jgi:SAM-dependent methyltransferase
MSRVEETLKYYTNRVALMPEVLKLRAGSPCKEDDLHAITGYDYLSLEQWDALLENLILKKINFAEVNQVLDAGCGSGAVIDFLKRRNPHLIGHGVDLTPKLLEVARSRVPGVNFSQGDITDPAVFANLPPNFDLVTCFGVFIHLDSPEKARQALDNFLSVLR